MIEAFTERGLAKMRAFEAERERRDAERRARFERMLQGEKDLYDREILRALEVILPRGLAGSGRYSECRNIAYALCSHDEDEERVYDIVDAWSHDSDDWDSWSILSSSRSEGDIGIGYLFGVAEKHDPTFKRDPKLAVFALNRLPRYR